MYKFVTSLLRPNIPGTTYTKVDLTNVTMKTLLQDYISGYIVLTHTTINGELYIDLNTLRTSNLPINNSIKFPTWLNTLGNLRIPALPSKPNFKLGRVIARDAILAGCKLSMIEPNKVPPSDAVITNKTNIYVKYLPKQRSALANRVITTVNGLAHRNTYLEDGIQIIGGGHSALHAHSMNVGLISFENIADIIQFPITEENLSRTSPATPYKDSFVIDLDINLTDKSIVLSLGGYLYFNPDFVSIINPDSGLIRVNMSKIDIPLNITKSRKLIDLDILGLFDSEDTDDESYGLMRLRDVTSDVAVKKWLTLEQSFVVVVKTDNLAVTKHQAHWTGVFGSFDYHENPVLPLQDLYGRLPEYWVKRQNETWVVQVQDPIYKERTHMWANEYEKEFVNDAMPYQSDPYIPMTFLEITSMTK